MAWISSEQWRCWISRFTPPTTVTSPYPRGTLPCASAWPRVVGCWQARALRGTAGIVQRGPRGVYPPQVGSPSIPPRLSVADVSIPLRSKLALTVDTSLVLAPSWSVERLASAFHGAFLQQPCDAVLSFSACGPKPLFPPNCLVVVSQLIIVQRCSSSPNSLASILVLI